MTQTTGAGAGEGEKGAWHEIFRGGLRLYSALIIGGIAMQATQMLVIAIIMPTIVADIGGADYCRRSLCWDSRRHRLGAATEPLAVGDAVTAVYLFCRIPFGLAAVFMFRFVRLSLPRERTQLALAD